ncbi:MAG: response regulator transcription factor [Nitrospinaceae bacterium]|mgnify:FL=1|nr:response regulator transcription factor [Nitrospinaceae bacterium]MBT3820990.1 response regulator transcription factor [Nitrospinaceae bacterium]
MSEAKILLVDDESDVLEGLIDYLGSKGFDVDTATSGEMALDAVKTDPPDLVILDVRMPGMDGIEVCRRLRKLSPSTRIIFLSALQQDVDKAKGLMIGGDDYIAKPFSTLELLARVKAVLRRGGAPEPPQIFEFGDIKIVPIRREVTRAGEIVEMTAKEFDLVYYLVQHQGEALSRDQLLESVWGQDQFPTTRTVDFHIFQLRKKLEENSVRPEFFRTIRGVGYKFVNE